MMMQSSFLSPLTPRERRRRSKSIFLLISLFLLFLLFPSSSSSSSPPNIIILLADDVGWNDVTFHSSSSPLFSSPLFSSILTPNLDMLSSRAINIPSYYTSPLCTPSRAALLSGIHPVDSGEQHFVLTNGEPRGFDLNHDLLPQLLKRGAKYSSHLVGKWNLGFFQKEFTPTFRGFDSFFGFYGNKIDYFDHVGESGGKIGADLRHNLDAPNVTQTRGTYVTHLITQRVMKLIDESSSSSSPLYLQVSYPNTHVGNSADPYQAPKSYIDMMANLARQSKEGEQLTEDERQERERKLIYAANMFTMDESIGAIIQKLTERQMIQNSIIIFASDNGSGDRGIFPNGGSNFPLRGVKGTLWEGALRVPAFIYSPLLDHEKNNSSSKKNNFRSFGGLFHVTDWLPTLLEAANLTPPPSLYGMSMWSALKSNGSMTSPRHELLHNLDPIDDVAAIRAGKFKFIRGHIDPALSGWFGAPSRHTRFFSSQVIERARASCLVFKTLESANLDHDEEALYDSSSSMSLTCLENDTDQSARTSSCDLDGCLFDIEADPCERNDISRQFPEVVFALKARLSAIASTSREPQSRPTDPESDPAKHCDTWTEWRDPDHIELQCAPKAQFLTSSTSSSNLNHHHHYFVSYLISFLVFILSSLN